MTLVLSPAVDQVVVDRICDQPDLWPDQRVTCRAERDAAIRVLRRRGVLLAEIARRLHMSHRRAAAIIALLEDERVWQLDPPGRCDRCPARPGTACEWQIIRPDCARGEYCTTHATAVLAALDAAQTIPAGTR